MNIVVIGVIILFLTFYLSKRVEKFTGVKAIVTADEYKQEIRNLSSLIGPYIGDLYLYLRNKYHNTVTGGVAKGPFFKPMSVADPTLADPLLPIARAQVKAWIDATKLRIAEKYDKPFIIQNATRYDIFYRETPQKVLEVIYVDNGQATTFVL